MEGFDYERARKELRIPDEFQVEAMAAVGRPGAKEVLPEKLQARESPDLPQVAVFIHRDPPGQRRSYTRTAKPRAIKTEERYVSILTREAGMPNRKEV